MEVGVVKTDGAGSSGQKQRQWAARGSSQVAV